MGSGSTTGVIPSNGAWGYSTQTPETFDSSTLTPNLSSVVPGGTYASLAHLELNPLDPQFGAKGDLRRATDAVFTAGNNVVFSPGGLFQANRDEGKVAACVAAGPTPGQTATQNSTLITSIDHIIDNQHAYLTVAPIVSVSNFFYWFTDDWAALQAWLTALSTLADWRPPGTTSPCPPLYTGYIQGKFGITKPLVGGSTANRLDGLTIRTGGKEHTQVGYFGAGCDAATVGAGGTFPNDNPGEYIWRFRSTKDLQLGPLTLFTPAGDIHCRTGLWVDADKGGGYNVINGVEVKNCVTGIHMGSAATYQAGQSYSTIGPNPTIPAGQFNGNILSDCEVGNCLEGVRYVGGNGESEILWNFSPQAPRPVVGLNGRGITWQGGDQTLTAPNFDCGPVADANNQWLMDLRGSGLTGAQPYVIRDVRLEDVAGIFRLRTSNDAGVEGAAVTARAEGLSAASTPAADYTVTGYMDLTNGHPDKFVVTAGTIDTRAGGKIITVPNKGAGGASLVGRIINFVAGGAGTGVAWLNVSADPAADTTPVAATVTGLTNPTALVDFRSPGAVVFSDCDLPQIGAYAAFQQFGSGTRASLTLARCRLPNSMTDDPSTLVLVDASAGSDTGGVDIKLEQCQYGLSPFAGIPDRRAFISTNMARSFNTTIAAGSNGAVLPQATIHLAAAPTKTSGTIVVNTDQGAQLVAYTGVSGNDITGCTGGLGTMSTGGRVTQQAWPLAVTQQTNRTTGVTANNRVGQITTNTASLAAGAAATFTVTCSQMSASDVVNVSIVSGQTNKETSARVTRVAAGVFDITVFNQHASTAEVGAIVINFTVTKGSL